MSDEGGIEKIDLNKVDWRGSREFFESLGEALDKLDDHDESYDFTWVGKRKSIIEAGAPINKTLRPDVENSKNWDTTENLFIEGDNLDALKLLQESYLGKVKMIYIDPPYNTGKDFVYHDNFRADTEQYDEDTEYKDDEGNIQFKKNEKSNGRYHSDWLSMMYPRLKLARNLLSDDGVIFISIDDNEQANLRKLCDEVFGEDNFIAQCVRKRRDSQANLSQNISPIHEYVFIYTRNQGQVLNKITPNIDERTFKNPDNDPRGPYVTMPCTNKGGSVYSIITPTGKTIEEEWRFKRDTYDRLASENRLVFPRGGDGKPRYKLFLSEKMEEGVLANTWLDNVDSNQVGTREVKELFGGESYFDNPKPTDLINWCMELSVGKEDIALDFFSGSATTAHAVMQLNAEDGGNRKWIMVQLPEETDEKSEAYKAGYKTIPEISRERIRRAGDKIASEHPDAKVDYGFRALRIDDTNHKDVYRPAADYQQNMLDDLVDNVKEDRSDLDLLYGVLTATAWELNKPLETVELDGATVYKYDYFGEVSGLVACFADEISEEAIKQIAQLKPLTAVFKEGSFPNSQAKVNLAEHFRIISPDTKVKVI
ncbi:site-specific DNA-methyltransferase [Candidatus Saccharibacteria bacterium]|nr:site-specific DNA-methyltransferase [Candidatus Saccharibacteria bacterium]